MMTHKIGFPSSEYLEVAIFKGMSISGNESSTISSMKCQSYGLHESFYIFIQNIKQRGSPKTCKREL